MAKNPALMAHRRYYLDGRADRAVRIRIERPIAIGRCWICHWRVTGIGHDATRRAIGLDSLQAIQAAYEQLRATLRPYRHRLAWTVGMTPDQKRVINAEFREVLVPESLGREFETKVSDLIDAETERIAAMCERGERPSWWGSGSQKSGTA